MLKLAKGVKDISPSEKLLFDSVLSRIISVFRRYGFVPLDTPVIERFEVLSSKYTGGEEILKETFRFKDQGGRDLGLRYDLTVPLARFVGMHPELKFPFKRYQVGRVFRDGPVKLGRYREFYQCDADIVGSSSVLADVEVLLLVLDVFDVLGIDVEVQVNDRRVLDGLMSMCGVPDSLRDSVILSLDKVVKLGVDLVRKELVDKGLSVSVADLLLELTSPPGDNEHKLEILRSHLGGNEGLLNVERVLGLIGDSRLVFTPGLARGLSYYTGVIFEVFSRSGPVSGSLSAGGRYDRMIGELTGRGSVPAVGLSFGLAPIMDTLSSSVSFDSPFDVFVIPINQDVFGLKVVRALRSAGVRAGVDLMGRGISSNLKFANSLGVPFVVIVGDDEVSKGVVQLKDMSSGSSEFLSLSDLVSRFS